MTLRIADTFTTSLARLTTGEQKSLETTAFDLELNPANPIMGLYKLDRARDDNSWSAGASRGIRRIVHRAGVGVPGGHRLSRNCPGIRSRRRAAIARACG